MKYLICKKNGFIHLAQSRAEVFDQVLQKTGKEGSCFIFLVSFLIFIWLIARLLSLLFEILKDYLKFSQRKVSLDKLHALGISLEVWVGFSSSLKVLYLWTETHYLQGYC